MKNPYIKLRSDIAAQLFSALKTFPYPCCFFNAGGVYAGCSSAAENTGTIIKDFSRYSDQDYRTCRCSNAGESFCTVVLPNSVPEWAEGYILTLFREILQGKEYSELMTLRKLRSFYAGQLANLETPTADLKAFLHTENYTGNYPRAAVLISFENDIDSPEAVHSPVKSLSAALSLDVEQASFFNEEDIFGPLADNLFLYFKAVGSETLEGRIDYLTETAENLCRMCRKQFSKTPVIAIGSVYTSVNDLHQSYNEAFFLIQNSHILQLNDETDGYIMLIQNYLAEYLSSQLLSSQYDILYRDYHRFFISHPLEKEILAPLSFSNINMIRTGELLDIHRNTVLQRYHKIESETGLSPRSSISDRLLLRSYLLNSSKSVVLHAGVHIQENSVQYRGLRYLSKLLNEKSGGTLQLQIGHLSTAGNNIELLRIIESGSLDIGICGNAAL
ncbi:MAG: helix-turn-helix domain-containing protein, partial [Solobacterium sp.]|nr:helix-turn-helix domain-containing protein [Solobacterium sp.]